MPAKKAVTEAVDVSSEAPKKERKPRKKKEVDSSAAPKKLSAYNVFVKENYHKVSSDNPTEKPAAILKRVSVMWNEHKEQKGTENKAKPTEDQDKLIAEFDKDHKGVSDEPLTQAQKALVNEGLKQSSSNIKKIYSKLTEKQKAQFYHKAFPKE